MTSTAPLAGDIAAILAAAPAAAQICRPRWPAPPTANPTASTGAADPLNVARTPPITEHQARVALAQRGVGGGLQAHRVGIGWLFTPYRGTVSLGSQSAVWLVTDTRQVHDLTSEDVDADLLRYGSMPHLR